MYEKLPTDTRFPGLAHMRARADRRKRLTYAFLASIAAFISATIVGLLYVIAWAASVWGSSIGDQFSRARDATVRRPARHISIVADAHLGRPVDRVVPGNA